jgi:hypothetical protein
VTIPPRLPEEDDMQKPQSVYDIPSDNNHARASIAQTRAESPQWNGHRVVAALRRREAPVAAGTLRLLPDATLLVGSYVIFDEEVSSLELQDGQGAGFGANLGAGEVQAAALPLEAMNAVAANRF